MDTIERLKKLILEKNLTQHDVVCASKVQGTTLNRWLLGKSKPSYSWVKILEEYLDKEGY